MSLGDLVQKAVYLGIGVASYAGEKAGERLQGLRDQVQKMADEMVERGEMNADEAKKFVDDMIKKAQQQPGAPNPTETAPPKSIEITDETDGDRPKQNSPVETAEAKSDEAKSDDIDIETMRRQVQELQDELRRLRKS
jgi:polyhydroxyalkanoate synthesis regulator phasin